MSSAFWSAEQARGYLGISKATFYRREKKPDFPRRHYLSAYPKWKADEIIAWAENQKAREVTL